MRPSRLTVRTFPGIAITTSWDRKVLDTRSSFFIGTVSTVMRAGLPAEEVETMSKAVMPSMPGLEPLISKREYENVAQGKRSEKEILLDKKMA